MGMARHGHTDKDFNTILHQTKIYEARRAYAQKLNHNPYTNDSVSTSSINTYTYPVPAGTKSLNRDNETSTSY